MKEAYAKVKVEVAALEVEVEELKDVLQVLKASKADKEALEGGDINSILFASAGSGSRGGTEDTRVLVRATQQNGTKKQVGPVTVGHTAGPIEMVKEEINNFIDSPSYDPLSLLSFIHPLDKDIRKPLACE